MRRTETRSGAKSGRFPTRSVAAAALAAIAAIAALAFATAGTGAPTSSGSTAGDKYKVKLKSGKTFSLAPSIRSKIAAHKAINYVFSYGSCSIQGFSQQYQAGYSYSLSPASKIYPIKG